MKGKRLQAARVVGQGHAGMGLEELARLAETTAEAVRNYVELGLLGEEVQRRGQEVFFGEGELYLVRRIEQLRVEHGVPSQAAGIILDLAARVEELESEIRSLREALGR